MPRKSLEHYRAKQAEWYLRNRAKQIDRSQKYRVDHKEQTNQTYNLWYQKNKERINESKKANRDKKILLETKVLRERIADQKNRITSPFLERKYL